MRCKRAFTLVELLVVIAIITILIAILLPILMRAKRQAQFVVCQANLRSIGQAMTLYVTDWKYYPGGWKNSYTNPSGFCAIWPVRLRSVIGGDQKIFYCPARGPEYVWSYDMNRKYVAGTEEVQYGYKPMEPVLFYSDLLPGDGQRFSYSYNVWGIWWDDGDAYARAFNENKLGLGGVLNTGVLTPKESTGEMKATKVRKPSEMIAVADSEFSNYILNPIHFSRLPAKIHSGGANVLFCDGHVQWYLQKDLLVGDGRGNWHTTNEPIRKYWNNDNDPHNIGPW